MTPGGVIRDILCGSGKFYKSYFSVCADESITDTDNLAGDHQRESRCASLLSGRAERTGRPCRPYQAPAADHWTAANGLISDGPIDNRTTCFVN